MTTGTPEKGKVISPLESLNDQLREKNEILDGLIVRLRDRLHSLSINIPTEQDPNKLAEPDLPFNDGILKEYHFSLGTYQNLINQLSVEVLKIEKLI